MLTGDPVLGMKIVLSGAHSYSATTNAAGEVTLHVPPGKYIVSNSCGKRPVTVRAEGPTTASLHCSYD